MRAPEAPPRLREQQYALTRHLRDPQGQPAPEGIEERRMQVYRELVFNNVASLLAGNFPVIRRLLGDEAWPALMREFLRDHRCQTPLFPELAREFLKFLQARGGDAPPLPPFLLELAHYEWVELALQISDAELPPHAHDGDLLGAPPVVSPLAWPLAYAWPVHRIGPDFRPTTPGAEPTLLLVRRDHDGEVRFSELSPLAFRLLQRLSDLPALGGRDQLLALADEAGHAGDPGFVEQGLRLLEQMRASDVILGTAPA